MGSVAQRGSRPAQQHLLAALPQPEAGVLEGFAVEEGLEVVNVHVAAPLLQLPAARLGGAAQRPAS